MDLPVILAHGALGNFDEVIMLSVAVILIVMMGISWVKSRMTEVEFDDEEPVEKEKQERHQEADSNNTTDDHFRLD